MKTSEAHPYLRRLDEAIHTLVVHRFAVGALVGVLALATLMGRASPAATQTPAPCDSGADPVALNNIGTGQAGIGAKDVQWTLASAPAGVALPLSLYGVAAYPGWVTPSNPADNWITGSSAGAITRADDPSAVTSAGDYRYTLSFNVPGSSASVLLQFAADNGVYFYLDSNTSTHVASVATPKGFVTLQAATVPVTTPGPHTLNAVVHNDESFTGLLVEGQVCGSATTAPTTTTTATPILTATPTRTATPTATPAATAIAVTDYQNPPLNEQPDESFVTLPTVDSIKNPCNAASASCQGAVQNCDSLNGQPPRNGHDIAIATGTLVPDDQETQQSVILDPSVSMPNIDTTTDTFMAGCMESYDSDPLDYTGTDALKSQLDPSPVPTITKAGPTERSSCVPLVDNGQYKPYIVNGQPSAVPGPNGFSLENPSQGFFSNPACTLPPPLQACVPQTEGALAGTSTPHMLTGGPGDCGLDCRLPFCGRDVILVHGYRLGPLGDFFSGTVPAAQTTWPGDIAEFKAPNGYWFAGALDYWQNYVLNKLAAEYTKAGSTRQPRVLTIAYPVTQPMQVAADAMLSQIGDAIVCTSGPSVCPDTNVYTVVGGALTQLSSTNDPWTEAGADVPFCARQCVIVSHSTGGPVTNVAMGEAATTPPIASDPCSGAPNLQSIPNCYIKAHVAIEPAFSGSNHAALLVDAAAGVAALSPFLVPCPFWDAAVYLLTGTQGYNSYSFPDFTHCQVAAKVPNTITYDLTPDVMTNQWQQVMARSPVPTLIVATAHPTSYWPLMWSPLFPGFDDNTLTMDSQLGRRPQDQPYATVDDLRLILDRPNGGRSLLIASSAKAFGYFVNQTNYFGGGHGGNLDVSVAANYNLTPTGMQANVKGGNIPANSVGAGLGSNTFTFLQAASSHFFRAYFGLLSHDVPPGPPSTYNDPSSVQETWNPTICNRTPQGYDYQLPGILNTRASGEESRAIFDSKVYVPAKTDGIPLVSPRMQNALEKELVTRYRSWLFGGGIKWQRVYYRMQDWQCSDYLDYIDQFAVRQ